MEMQREHDAPGRPDHSVATLAVICQPALSSSRPGGIVAAGGAIIHYSSGAAWLHGVLRRAMRRLVHVQPCSNQPLRPVGPAAAEELARAMRNGQREALKERNGNRSGSLESAALARLLMSFAQQRRCGPVGGGG